jgi:hypothetical protein
MFSRRAAGGEFFGRTAGACRPGFREYRAPEQVRETGRGGAIRILDAHVQRQDGVIEPLGFPCEAACLRWARRLATSMQGHEPPTPGRPAGVATRRRMAVIPGARRRLCSDCSRHVPRPECGPGAFHSEVHAVFVPFRWDSHAMPHVPRWASVPERLVPVKI